MNVISRKPDYTLNNVQSGFGRMQEHEDVTVPRRAIGNQLADPLGGWSQQDAVDENVIADQQRVLHRAGWNGERLQREGDDEQSGHQHDSDGGNELGSSLLGLLRFLRLRRRCLCRSGFHKFLGSSQIGFSSRSCFVRCVDVPRQPIGPLNEVCTTAESATYGASADCRTVDLR